MATKSLAVCGAISRGYRGYGAGFPDLIQEGSVGLMRFAVHWIRASIHSFLFNTIRSFKFGTSRIQRKLFFKLRSMKTAIMASGITKQRVAQIERRALDKIGIFLGRKSVSELVLSE